VGKTRIAVLAVKWLLLYKPDALILIIVPTQQLRDDDWPAEFKRWGCAALLPRVKIICYNSITRLKPGRDIDLLILDEVHHLTPKWATDLFERTDGVAIVDVLGLTATLPGRKWEDQALKRDLIDKYCPSCYKLSLEDAITLELVADFEVFVLKYALDNRDKVHTLGGRTYTEFGLYQHLTRMIQKGVFGKKPGMKAMAMQKRMALMRSLPTKSKLARIAMDNILPGKRTLIFCGSISQCNALCGPERVYHSQSGTVALDRFLAGELDWLGVVNALNEGKNVPMLDQSLIVQLDSNERNIIQRIGRNVRYRPGHKAKIFVLVVAGTVDEQWYRSAFREFDTARIRELTVTID
jgi:superfamily II DNA or RNA helicase